VQRCLFKLMHAVRLLSNSAGALPSLVHSRKRDDLVAEHVARFLLSSGCQEVGVKPRVKVVSGQQESPTARRSWKSGNVESFFVYMEHILRLKEVWCIGEGFALS